MSKYRPEYQYDNPAEGRPPMLDLDAFGRDFAVELSRWLDANPKQRAIDEYYRVRLAPGNILNNEDKVMLEELCRRWAPGSRVVEIGCGYAQMSAYLAAAGYLVTATDHDRVRHVGTKAVRDALATKYPLVARLDVQLGTWPTSFPTVDYDVLLAGNVINSFWKQWDAPEEEKLRLTLRDRDAVLNTRVWWKDRGTAGERADLVREFVGLGYAVTVLEHCVVYAAKT